MPKSRRLARMTCFGLLGAGVADIVTLHGGGVVLVVLCTAVVGVFFSLCMPYEPSAPREPRHAGE